MKSLFLRFLLLPAFVFLGLSSSAQKAPLPLFAPKLENPKMKPDSPERLAMALYLAPFYHGVASGDPLEDRVIIWTRVTTTETADQSLSWEMSTDISFAHVVQKGECLAKAENDFTTKVDVTGLSPNTWYYYRFKHGQKYSSTGRTRTTPIGDVNQTRLAVVSCAHIKKGFYNAFRAIGRRNDLDAVVHLGDYFYEYHSTYEAGESHSAINTCVDLNDYRLRHSQSRLDPDLQFCHQQLPFILIWDDHEVVNNSYKDGAQNHYPWAHGDYARRKAAAVKAYLEWMPIRSRTDSNGINQIYRTLKFGNLIDLIMLDERLEGRDEQKERKFDYSTAPDRTMLGKTQLEWFLDQLKTSKAKWRLVGQQVMIAHLQKFNKPLNPDQWDGYPHEREKILKTIVDNKLNNVVFLTGDIHTSWANEVYINRKDYNVFSAKGSVLVEFVTPSVSAANAPRVMPAWFFTVSNRHVKYLDLWNHGYLVVDVTPEKTQGDWYFVNSLKHRTNLQHHGQGRYTRSGEAALRRKRKTTAKFRNPALAPSAFTDYGELKKLTPTDSVQALYVWGNYPIQVENRFCIGLNTTKSIGVKVKMIDPNGKIVSQTDLGTVETGYHVYDWGCKSAPAGEYSLVFETADGKQVISKPLVKIELPKPVKTE